MNTEEELKKLQDQRDKKREYNRQYYHKRVKPKKMAEKDEIEKIKTQFAQIMASPNAVNLNNSSVISPQSLTSPSSGNSGNSGPSSGAGFPFELSNRFIHSGESMTVSTSSHLRESSEIVERENHLIRQLREENNRLNDLLNRTRSDSERLVNQINVLKKDNYHLAGELEKVRHENYELLMQHSSQLLPQLN